MLHRNRTWSLQAIDDAERLAIKLSNVTWTCCQAFVLKGYIFANDATSADGAQEYAILRGTQDCPELIQIESITFSWCTEERMEELYFAKGGRSRFFNCTNLGLSMADVLRLETAISNDALPSTSGFFFGKSYGDEKDGDLNFIFKARTAIEDGKRVFYRPWW